MARPSRKNSINAIAEKAGVSISAVSIVLNNRPGLSDATRQKIIRIIEQSNYKRNYKRKTGSHTIGLVLTGLWEDNYLSEIIKGVMAYISERDNLNIATIIHIPESKTSLYETLRLHNCDIAVMVKSDRIMDDLQELAEKGLPFILADAGLSKSLKKVQSPMIGCVDNSSYEGSYAMAQFLIEAGHKKIAYITHKLPFPNKNHNQRVKGWQTAVQNTLKSSLNIKNPCFCILDHDNIPQELIMLIKKKKITAVMAVDDLLALKVLGACYKNGITVPEDVSVVGFGDFMNSQFFSPPLTTVDQKSFTVGYEVAKQAGEYVCGEINELSEIVLDTELVIRDSVLPIK